MAQVGSAWRGRVLGLLVFLGAALSVLVWVRHIQAIRAQVASYAALREGNLDHLRVLLDAGVDVNQPLTVTRKRDQKNLLMIASGLGDTAALQLLLSRGADVDLRNRDGMTALLLAAAADHPEAVEMLVEHGADPHERSGIDGQTPLLVAARSGAARALAALLALGADVNQPSAGGETPLLAAARGEGTIEVFALIMDRGADVDFANGEGTTPLIAAAEALKDPRDLSVQNEKINRLITAGANVDAQDEAGRTALLLAAATSPDAVRSLIQAGADVHLIDQYGQTALHLAALRGTPETVFRLLEAGADPSIIAHRARRSTALDFAAGRTDPDGQAIAERLRALTEEAPIPSPE